MKIVNLTPHAITVRLESGDRVFEPSGTEARVATTATPAGEVDGIPVVAQTYGEIEDLPAPEPDTLYLVSAIVLAAAKEAGRTDCIAPDTSPQGAIRDEAGRIVAVRRFVR